MFIHDYYDYNYDVRQLQKLPIYQGMTERDIKHLMAKIAVMEHKQWKDEVEVMMADQRKKTLEYMAKMETGDGYKPLPTDPVVINHGVKIYPTLMDDQGFISEDRLRYLKKTMRLSLGEKKIYLEYELYENLTRVVN